MRSHSSCMGVEQNERCGRFELHALLCHVVGTASDQTIHRTYKCVYKLA